MDEIVKVLILKDGTILLSKVREVEGYEIGEPDCVMIDPVLYDPNRLKTWKSRLTRFPGKQAVTSGYPDGYPVGQHLNDGDSRQPNSIAEYLVTIGD